MFGSNGYDDEITGAFVRGGSFHDDEADELQQKPQSSFFGLTRGVCRFGVMAAGSLTLTLLFRLMPSITPIGWIALGCGIGGLALYCTFTRSAEGRMNAMVIATVALFGILCGTWDVIAMLFTSSSLIWQVGVVGAVFVAVIAIDYLRKGNGNA